MTNDDIARQLQRQARQLAEKYGNLYRIRAYRRAAQTVLGLPRSVIEFQPWELEALPGIGDHLALAITHYARTGNWKTYEELTSADLAV
jgi:DNA polymerase (family 10)